MGATGFACNSFFSMMGLVDLYCDDCSVFGPRFARNFPPALKKDAAGSESNGGYGGLILGEE